MCDVSLILPAFNEAATIASTIRETAAIFGRAACAMKSSWRPTATTARASWRCETARQGEPVRVIGNRERSGKGRGVREAMALARGDIVGYADADNKVPIEEFDKFRPWLAEGYDVVIGSRAHAGFANRAPPAALPPAGRQGFRICSCMRWSAWRASPIRNAASSSSRRAAAREIFSRQQIDGYMFDVEILVLARRLGYRIQQVPIRWRDDGDSRLALVSGNSAQRGRHLPHPRARPPPAMARAKTNRVQTGTREIQAPARRDLT